MKVLRTIVGHLKVLGELAVLRLKATPVIKSVTIRPMTPAGEPVKAGGLTEARAARFPIVESAEAEVKK
jgi:hypothetical protein